LTSPTPARPATEVAAVAEVVVADAGRIDEFPDERAVRPEKSETEPLLEKDPSSSYGAAAATSAVPSPLTSPMDATATPRESEAFPPGSVIRQMTARVRR